MIPEQERSSSVRSRFRFFLGLNVIKASKPSVEYVFAAFSSSSPRLRIWYRLLEVNVRECFLEVVTGFRILRLRRGTRFLECRCRLLEVLCRSIELEFLCEKCLVNAEMGFTVNFFVCVFKGNLV